MLNKQLRMTEEGEETSLRNGNKTGEKRGRRAEWFLTTDSDDPCGVCTSDKHGSDALWEVCRFHSDCTLSNLHSPEKRRTTGKTHSLILCFLCCFVTYIWVQVRAGMYGLHINITSLQGFIQPKVTILHQRCWIFNAAKKLLVERNNVDTYFLFFIVLKNVITFHQLKNLKIFNSQLCNEKIITFSNFYKSIN